jgi:hypothetical protein
MCDFSARRFEPVRDMNSTKTKYAMFELLVAKHLSDEQILARDQRHSRFSSVNTELTSA